MRRALYAKLPVCRSVGQAGSLSYLVSEIYLNPVRDDAAFMAFSQ
jgi:hypothetical protein